LVGGKWSGGQERLSSAWWARCVRCRRVLGYGLRAARRGNLMETLSWAQAYPHPDDESLKKEKKRGTEQRRKVRDSMRVVSMGVAHIALIRARTWTSRPSVSAADMFVLRSCVRQRELSLLALPSRPTRDSKLALLSVRWHQQFELVRSKAMDRNPRDVKG
jgi:hypothetical protein